MFSFFGFGGATSENTFVVTWNKERISITTNLADTTVIQLKEELERQTKVPVKNQKLIFGGAILANDEHTLQKYGLKEGSKMMMVGGISYGGFKMPESSQPAAPQQSSEEAMIARISKITVKSDEYRSRVKELVDTSDGFCSVDAKLEAGSGRALEAQRLDMRFMAINEDLLKVLISLDGVECPHEFEDARKRRREAVRQTQALMEQLDKAHGVLKKLIAASSA